MFFISPPKGATSKRSCKKSNSMSQFTSLEYVFSEDVVIAAVSNMDGWRLADQFLRRKTAIFDRKLMGGNGGGNGGYFQERGKKPTICEGRTVTPACLRRKATSNVVTALRYDWATLSAPKIFCHDHPDTRHSTVLNINRFQSRRN